ncbi:CDP-glycerol glycerophosphotransferase family protein [Pediococcus pentosaceus]|uniref:CDP-glycerol glycerophosphotransferase family protein n=1 Tax=Pediococcus pentosaceus TaxID=1255 RepID=UPI0022E118DF|nr:CDP-glycerol glycerophosphotransferase family protein [Pediococcus pentosaceus]
MIVLKTLLYMVSGFSFRNKNIFIFGAWFGKRYSDNSKFLADQIINSKKFQNKKIIWIGNESTWPLDGVNSIKFVKRNSIKSIWYQLRAGYAFVSHGYQDLGTVSLLKGAIVYQLWHGFPIKCIGADDPGNPNEGSLKYENYRFFLANSPVMAKRVKSAFKNYGANSENILIAKQPREDYLILNKDNVNLKKEIRRKLGIKNDQIVITYLPTFRDNSEKTFSFVKDSKREVYEYLEEKNAIILERQHFVRDMHSNTKGSSNGNRFVDLNEGIEVQDVLLITDYLITDYSSVYVDFIHLGKPIIHFLYDGDDYQKNDRGLYSNDPRKEFAGPIAYSQKELIPLLELSKDEFGKKRCDAVKNLCLNTSTSLIDLIENK